MIINRSGEKFEYEGREYVIGERVIANAESEYEGLYGTITEIRDGEDKDTENDTPDIFCTFESPLLPQAIREIEANFSRLYRQPMILDDINLEDVIMAPSMIKPVKSSEKCGWTPILKSVCAFSEAWEHKAPGKDALSSLPQPVKKVGHFRADHDGWRWWGEYFPCNDHLKTVEIAQEMVCVCRYLLEEQFAGKDGLKKLRDFCSLHPEACLDREGEEYDFFVTGEHANFWIRALLRHGDYNLYIHSLTK